MGLSADVSEMLSVGCFRNILLITIDDESINNAWVDPPKTVTGQILLILIDICQELIHTIIILYS